jgi:TRAP-type C4-dicarboxylate transport system substrate-binding protein
MTARFSRRGLLAALSLVLAGTASAQEITLKAVNGFQEGTYFAKNFERFIKKVNDEGKGVVQINYVGGPKAIPT